MRRSASAPVLIGEQSTALERVGLGKGFHDEAWLQALIFEHPKLIPAGDIEPGFGELIPAAREVSCGHGYIDNVYLTASGDIVIVETKLWSNPQARREVVAQALDYAAALSQMTYEQLESAILRPARTDGAKSLYAIVADHPDALDEADFVDAVALNLKRGRMLVIAAGDGVRREAETLATLLQSHAGAHFTFALVELAAYRLGESEQYVIVPATLVQTRLIDRGVVRIENGQAIVVPVEKPVAASTTSAGPKAQSLTEQSFYELMAARDPALPATIRSFIASIEPLGVYVDFSASLNLKVDWPGAKKPVNLGYIQKDGQLQMGSVGWYAPHPTAERYLQAIAAIVGGEVVEPNNWFWKRVTVGGKAMTIDMMLPAHADAWRAAIEKLLVDLQVDEERVIH